MPLATVAKRCKCHWQHVASILERGRLGDELHSGVVALYAKVPRKSGKESRQKLDQIAKIKLVNFVTNLPRKVGRFGRAFGQFAGLMA